MICCGGWNCASICWGNSPRSDHVCGKQMVFYFIFFHFNFLRLARGKGSGERCIAAGWWVVVWKGRKQQHFPGFVEHNRVKQHYWLTRALVTLGYEYLFLLLEDFPPSVPLKQTQDQAGLLQLWVRSKSPRGPSCAPHWRLQGGCQQTCEPISSPACYSTQTSSHPERMSKLSHYTIFTSILFLSKDFYLS